MLFFFTSPYKSALYQGANHVEERGHQRCISSEGFIKKTVLTWHCHYLASLP